jgi:hypothetical protein
MKALFDAYPFCNRKISLVTGSAEARLRYAQSNLFCSWADPPSMRWRCDAVVTVTTELGGRVIEGW